MGLTAWDPGIKIPFQGIYLVDDTGLKLQNPYFNQVRASDLDPIRLKIAARDIPDNHLSQLLSGLILHPCRQVFLFQAVIPAVSVPADLANTFVTLNGWLAFDIVLEVFDQSLHGLPVAVHG